MIATGDQAHRMDAIYATQRHFYDFSRKYYLLGRDALIENLAPPASGSVLEIGCGTARNLIAAAKRWPEARFFGIDISAAMLETARGKVSAAGLSARITLAQGDATAFDPLAIFGMGAFDRVFMSYTLSMIADWEKAIDRAAAALAPAGSLRIVDFGQQEALPRAWRRALFAWLAKFDVTPRRALPAAVETIAGARALAAEFGTRYRGYAWVASVSRAPA